MTKSFLPRDDRFMVYVNALNMLLLIYVFFNFACSFAWILCFSSFIVAVLWEYGGQKYKGMWQKSFPEIHFNYWIFASLFTHQKQNEMMFFFCVGIVEGRKCGKVSISSILYSWVVKGWLFDDPWLFHFNLLVHSPLSECFNFWICVKVAFGNCVQIVVMFSLTFLMKGCLWGVPTKAFLLIHANLAKNRAQWKKKDLYRRYQLIGIKL